MLSEELDDDEDGDDEDEEDDEESDELELDELELEEELELLSDGGLGRESVMYHPEPLNTIPGRDSSFFTTPPHSGQTLIGSSLKLCLRSNSWPQA